MRYATIDSIFDLMENTIARQQDLYEDYYDYKKAGNITEAEKVFSLIKTMDVVINDYHQLIVNYVKTEKPRVDDFDEDVTVFLENNEYYNYKEWYGYNYSDDLMEALEKEIFSDFIHELYIAVVDDDFYTSDEKIQAFINGFSKIDLYLYVISRR